jgi:hypothetical protein
MTLANRGKTIQQDGKRQTAPSNSSSSTLTKEQVTSFISRELLGWETEYIKDRVCAEFLGQGMTEFELKQIVDNFLYE